MTWQLLTALSILSFSLVNLLHRFVMKHVDSDAYAQTIAFLGITGIITLLISLASGGFHPAIPLTLLPLFSVLIILEIFAPYLAFIAFKHLFASEASIIMSSQRLWTVFIAFLFLREAFSVSKIAGTLLIIIGIGCALWKKEKIEINKGIGYAIGGALIYAIADSITFYLLRSMDAASLQVYITLLPVLIMIILKPKSIKKLEFYLEKKHAISIALVSLFDAIGTLTLFYAYQIGHNASQISPLMATTTIFSVILAILFLGENENTFKKFIGTLIVVIGVVLII
jgi:drug/metabolite transporter (DMT)-like permease